MAEKKTFPLRLSPELFDAIRHIADQEFRSVNGQMEMILSEYVRDRTRAKLPPPNRSPKKSAEEE